MNRYAAFVFAQSSHEKGMVWPTLQARAGERSAARASLDSLARELRAAGSSGSLLDATERELARLR